MSFVAVLNVVSMSWSLRQSSPLPPLIHSHSFALMVAGGAVSHGVCSRSAMRSSGSRHWVHPELIPFPRDVNIPSGRFGPCTFSVQRFAAGITRHACSVTPHVRMLVMA